MYKNIAVIVVLITAWTITACSYIITKENNLVDFGITSKVINDVNVIEDVISEESDAQQFLVYHNEFNRTKTYGINEARVKSIISEMNPAYFEGLNLLQIVHSNRQATKSNINGMYYPSNAQITLWVKDESDGYIRYLLYHELKHHYCWINQKDLSHQGCFLDTPIDREIGFIK